MDVRCKNCFSVYDSQYERCPHCGHLDGEPPKELYHLYPGTELLGRYVIGEVLGFGGFGITYKAWDKKFETVLAIKEYYPCGIVNRVPGTSEVILFTGKKKDIFINGLERFLDEAKNMAKFSQNNNIVNVFEYFEDNNTGYIVMELLEGISLNNYLMKQTKKLEMEEIMNITKSVCSALKDLHAIGIIHRDVSPDNIYMCSNGKIKLIDFGAARFSLNEEKKMTIILKPGFAPPEQYEKINKQGPWTDIYALGATVYLLLTGSKPDESTNRKVNDTVYPPRDLDPDIPEHVSNTIMKAIALDRKKRFATIDKFESALLKRTKVKDESILKDSNETKLISTIGVVIALIAVIVLCVGTLFSNRTVKLKATKLDVWYVSDNKTEKKYKDKAFSDMFAQFKKEQPKIDIEFHSYLSSEYSNKILQALNQSDAPDIFESTSINNSNLTKALGAKELYKLVEFDDYNLQKNIKSNKELTYKIPMAFDIPLIYANSLIASCKNTVITDIEDLGNVSSYGNTLGVLTTNKVLVSDVFSKNDISGLKLDTANPIVQLANDKLAYYFGTTKDYYIVQDVMSGNGVYKLIYVKNKTSNLLYRDCYSLIESGDKNHIKAIKEFYKFMYSNRGQDIYYISNRNTSIPLNKKAYESYCNLNMEMKNVLNKTNIIN